MAPIEVNSEKDNSTLEDLMRADDDTNQDDDKIVLDMDDNADPSLDEKKETDSKIKDKKVETKTDDEVDEADNEKQEDELEFIAPASRKEILKSFPELFKKFPFIEKAIYREKEFTELLASPADAREVIKQAESYQEFEKSILKGDISSVLNSVKDSDKKAFGNIVDTLLPTLQKVDNNAYLHVISDVIKRAVVSAYKTGTDQKNENLQAAASIIHEFIFGTKNYQPTGKFGSDGNPNTEKVSEEETKLENDRKQFQQEKFENAASGLESRVENVLKNTISSNIDPKQQMTDYVRRNATNDVLSQLSDVIESDERFTQIKDKLWEKAAESNFSRATLEPIERAYKSKAKTLLPSIIRKVRSEALNGLGEVSRTKITKDEDEPMIKRNVETRQREQPANKSSQGPNKRESTLDYLMRD